MDGADIGLANIELFTRGALSPVFTDEHPWTPQAVEAQVTALAAKTREIALPFIASFGDWDGVRDMIAKRIDEMNRSRPWRGGA